MTAIEARYRRLLRLYPADYRRERADELVGTYLETVDDGRRWPRVEDVADVFAGSVRQRVRAAGPAFAGGLRVAAVLALAAAGALSAIWLFFVELTGEPDFGPARTLGAVVWVAWLAVSVVALAAPRRYRRWLAFALLATVAVVPLAVLTPYGRPAVMTLLPQFALGMVAFGLDPHARRVARAVPAAAALLTTAVLQLFCLPHSPLPAGFAVSAGYRFEAGQVLPATGTLLGMVALVVPVLLGRRGLWALALLALPAALCFVEPAARRLSGKPSWNPADFQDLAAAAIGLTVAATVVIFGLRAAARRADSQGEPVRREG